MAYEYVKKCYKVNPIIGGRVTFQGSTRKGTIVRKRGYDHRVWVRFEGYKKAVPCHPLDLIYEESQVKA